MQTHESASDLPEGLTAYTKGVVELAESKGLHLAWQTGRSRHELTLTSPGPHGPSGSITVGTRSGKVIRGHITHGAGGPTTTADGTNAVRVMLSALARSACPASCRAVSVDACIALSAPQDA